MLCGVFTAHKAANTPRNGRISRVVGDMALACAEGTVQRFFSLSARIQRERKQCCDQLEATERGTLGALAGLVFGLPAASHAGCHGLLAHGVQPMP